MSKNSVLHLCSYYIGNKLYKSLFSLLSKNWQQEVYVPVKNVNLVGVNKLEAEGLSLLYDPFLKPAHKLLYGSKIKTQARRLESHLAQGDKSINDVDLIHAHTLFSDGGTAYLLSRKYDKPYVVSVRNTDINSFYKFAIHYRSFSHKVLVNAKKIIFISYAYKKLLLDVLPCAVVRRIQDKCIVIPNGISDVFLYNFTSRSVGGKGFESVKLLTSARLDYNKNIKSVIDLVYSLKKSGVNVKYKVAGDGPLRENIIEYVKSKGVSKEVVFLGQLSSEGLIKELDASDIFVMTSFKETFGISYIEAMARGLPVIYTKGQGIDGFFKQGEVGFSVNPVDVKAMQDAINEIIADYLPISDRCYELAQEFTWPIIANKYFSLYNEVV